MIIEKQPNGSLLITDIIHSQFIKKVYYFTSIKEAKKDFRKHCKEIANNWLEYLAR